MDPKWALRLPPIDLSPFPGPLTWHPSSIPLSNVSFYVPILGSKKGTCLSYGPALRGFQKNCFQNGKQLQFLASQNSYFGVPPSCILEYSFFSKCHLWNTIMDNPQNWEELCHNFHWQCCHQCYKTAVNSNFVWTWGMRGEFWKHWRQHFFRTQGTQRCF